MRYRDAHAMATDDARRQRRGRRRRAAGHLAPEVHAAANASSGAAARRRREGKRSVRRRRLAVEHRSIRRRTNAFLINLPFLKNKIVFGDYIGYRERNDTQTNLI